MKIDFVWLFLIIIFKKTQEVFLITFPLTA